MPQRRHVYNMGEYATQRRRQAYDAHMRRHIICRVRGIVAAYNMGEYATQRRRI